MFEEAAELKPEQHFQLRLMSEQVEQMDKQQLKDMLLKATRLLMMRQNVVQALVMKAAGMERSATFKRT